MQKLVSLIRSHLFIFAFISIALGDWRKKTLVPFMSENVLPMISSRSFMGSCLKSLSRFLFVLGVRVCSNFTDLHADVQLSQHHLLKRLFPTYIVVSLAEDQLIVSVWVFRFILFRTLCTSCTWVSVSFSMFEKFSVSSASGVGKAGQLHVNQWN